MKLTTYILLFLFPAPVMAVDSYLCITEQSVGFKFNNKTKTWSNATFKLGDKYIVKRDKNKSAPWRVYQFDEEEYVSKVLMNPAF